MYFNKYLSLLSSELSKAVEQTANEFNYKLQKIDATKKIKNILLLGNVQSGKTSHILGIVSRLADEDLKFFIYLTTDSIDLQAQTLDRIRLSLKDFHILSENDLHLIDEGFKLNKPVILVIKKNSRVLKAWRDTICSKKYLSGYQLIIVDDEADSASLNTKVNKYGVSTINSLLIDIRNSCYSCTFIEVTATPQAILLQDTLSDWQPDFIQYFEPGSDYIGGNFVFTDPKSYIVQFIEDELTDTTDESAEIPNGLNEALLTFLITCAQFSLTGKKNCNFIVHPSVRINDHFAFSQTIKEHLNEIAFAFNDGENLTNEFIPIWSKLQSTKPDLYHYEVIYEKVKLLIEEESFLVSVLNSKNETNLQLNYGFNIIIGGNVIGRGLTIPHLQTVYYSRTAKKPNADTFWQHARIFGYDRDTSLLRLFIPQDVYKFFVDLNDANNLLIEQTKYNLPHEFQIIYPDYIQPTRKNVLNNSSIFLIAGGKNYFSAKPNESNLENTGNIINIIKNTANQVENGLYNVDHTIMIQTLKSLGKFDENDWNSEKFQSCIHALQSKLPSLKNYILIRENRRISKGTGTMLSPDDRLINNSINDAVILTLYGLTGEVSLGWNGHPFWMPNIKFPNKLIFWSS